jgi:hypothetical protein
MRNRQTTVKFSDDTFEKLEVLCTENKRKRNDMLNIIVEEYLLSKEDEKRGPIATNTNQKQPRTSTKEDSRPCP